MAEWISMKDRLPKAFEDVLTYAAVSHDIFVDYTDENGVFSFDSGLDPVTHWMPLPEPPKEEGE